MIPEALTPGQRSHLRVLVDACRSVEVLGFTADAEPVVRRIDQRPDTDPMHDVTYAIAASGAGIDGVVISPPDADGVYDLPEADFALIRGC